MKKLGIIFAVLVVIGAGIYYFISSSEIPQTTENYDSDSSQSKDSDDTDTFDESEPREKKDTLVQDNLEPIPDKKLSPETFSKELETTITKNREEIEECEGNLDRLFGNALEEEDASYFEESNINNILDEFDNLTLTPKSSSKLLELLAQDNVSSIKTDDLGNKLRDLRPCRPYKKMSFIHNLMTHFGKGKWSDETKQRAVKSVFNYFDKELENHTTISNLNMQAALLQTLVSEGMLSKKYEEQVMDYKDDLEDAYDELLDRADEIKEEKEEKGESMDSIPLEIIQKEFQISGKYRKGLKRLIKDLQNESN